VSLPSAAIASPSHAFSVLAAPADWAAIDFISDLHLSAQTPHTFEAWAQHLLHTPADAVLMLGDVFEVWVGDDARHDLADGFEAQCLAVLQAASSQRAIGFMAGNRDFLLGPAMRADAGLIALPDPLRLDAFGGALLLSHGDALCLADTDYLRFRAEVRSAAWQADFLARPLDERRAIARGLRERSMAAKAAGGPAELWADVDTVTAVALCAQAACGTLVHGHTHRPAVHTLSPAVQRWVLSDWDLDDPGKERADVIRWTAQGLQRVAPASARHV
jgi:UDP-2,3-diacylglucosamine hydrolase